MIDELKVIYDDLKPDFTERKIKVWLLINKILLLDKTYSLLWICAFKD